MGNSDDAEAAVREMNGRAIRGHTLHVEHIHEPPADGQVTNKSCTDLFPAAHSTGSTGAGLIQQSSNNIPATKVSRTQQTPRRIKENNALYHCASSLNLHLINLKTNGRN